MFCKNCGIRLENGSTEFCPNCGLKVNGHSAQNLYTEAPLKQQVNKEYQSPKNEPQQSVNSGGRKKRSGCLTALLVFIIVIAGIALAAYFLLPGVFKPNDLGIKTSDQAYESAVQKLGYTKDKAPSIGAAQDYKYTYGSPKAADISLTSEEITSFLNVNRPPYYAIKNVQVRINPDNTVEAAASLDVPYVFNYILDGKYNKDDAKKALPMLGLLPDKINVYSKFSGGVRNNRIEKMSIDKVSIMGIPIPGTLVNTTGATSFVKSSIDNYIGKETSKQNSRYDLLEVNNGNLVFKGQIPSSISRTPLEVKE